MKSNKLKLVLIFLLIAIISLQTACTAMVVGGAAAGAAVAIDRRTAGSIVEDENIEIKFTHAYFQNKQVHEKTHINATSYNGWLLLTGEAPNVTLKGQIQDMASNITNVKRIFNEIALSSPTSLRSRSSDTYITSKVKAQLYSNNSTKGYHVKVITENGIVYLMGIVSESEANNATEVVRKVAGVKRVVKLFEYQ